MVMEPELYCVTLITPSQKIYSHIRMFFLTFCSIKHIENLILLIHIHNKIQVFFSKDTKVVCFLDTYIKNSGAGFLVKKNSSYPLQ